MARPDLAEVLLRFGAAYRATHALPRGADKVWRAIVACRTPALGGYVETCSCCGTTRHVYRSCRNRHCPRCQTRAKEAWIAARRREVLPVPYFHLVFTLPHALHPLIAAAPRLLYENLFAAVSATLSEFAANPRHLGGASAFSLILHTWQQDLSRHVHLHALVAGGALSSEGTWRFPKKGFLFPVKALSRVFRGKFVAGLSSAFGKQALPGWLDARAWRRLKSALHAHEWVVYAKSPLGGPTAVLEYLGRYTHRVAISNERIMAIEAGDVLFRMRPQPESGTRRVGRLPGATFIERFLQHVLPAGFKRIRHYGLLSPARKKTALAAARAALDVPPPDTEVIESFAAFMGRIGRAAALHCPRCGSPWQVTGFLPPTRSFALCRGPP